MSFRSWNPSLNEKTFEWLNTEWEKMTLNWTVEKSIFLVWLTILSAVWVWNYADLVMPFYIPLIILWFIIAMIIIFKKTIAPYLSPVYAIMEWIILWALSALFEQQFPGIVIQAVTLTFWTFVSLLLAYKSWLIKATENFKLWVVAATGWIAMIYVISLVWSIFGWYDVPYIHESGLIWILFSIFVVIIAALNLVLDFDFIESWVEKWAPKYMEWYASFSLLVTLVWLYLEILRLLAKMRSR